MFIAEFETRHFSFLALGETEQLARKALRVGWKKHCRQKGADPDCFNGDDVSIAECQVGQCLRDHELLK
jgi:hypothetical protein